MEKTVELLSGLKMTVAGGIFLAASLICMLAKVELPINPAWITVAICGIPIVFKAFKQIIFRRKISSPLLISIAMFAAVYIGEVFAAGEVAFIMAIGGILEDMTVERAKRGIKNLVSLAPARGRIVTEGGEKEVVLEDIKAGDILRVLPGESIPVDGEIISGQTSVDQSVMTGESLPVDKGIGDKVYCGTINRFGSIDIKALKVGKDSSFGKLVEIVREAEQNKSPTERIVDKWASWLVPSALVIAVATYLFTGDITRAVTVLVVFCPCALVLATPTSVMAAIGQAAKYGVIVKSGAALEKMGKVDCAAFDKTGTLTLGKPSVSDIIVLDKSFSESDLLFYAASAESRSEHPLGKAVVSRAAEEGIGLSAPDDFTMVPGRGVCAVVGGRKVLCGNAEFMDENSVEIEEATGIGGLRNAGKAVILVAIGGRFAGAMGLSDVLKENASSIVSELEEMGTESILLTGDNPQAAEFIASKIGIKRVFAGLLPLGKVEKIKELRSAGKKVCMVGDGVNDAPALKIADVGVAMGAMGSDIAVDAAEIALMGDDVSKIPYLKRLSMATVSLIKFNISLSMAINIIAITLSVMALLNPVTGALVHNAGSVLVVLNAGLLYDRDYIKKKNGQNK